MKQIKNLLLLGCFAFAITLAFAFSPAQKASKTDTFYYVYSGSTATQGDYEVPGNWSEPLAEVPSGCNDGEVLPCVVVSSFDDKDDFILDIVNNGLSTGAILQKRH